MARVNKNALLQGLSGTLGGVTFRQVNGETIVSVAEGPKKGPGSPKQQAQRMRMHHAKLYAETLKQDPALKALYVTGITPRLKNARLVAIADFMNDPKIVAADLSTYQGRPGDLIRIQATDDFAVVAVQVRFYSTIEHPPVEHPAQLQPDGSWLLHIPAIDLPAPATLIEVIAFDRPGNQGIQQFTL